MDDQFSVDGTVYTINGVVVYAATLTYADGSAATVNLVTAQTTTGELFAVPVLAGQEASQAALEAAPTR